MPERQYNYTTLGYTDGKQHDAFKVVATLNLSEEGLTKEERKVVAERFTRLLSKAIGTKLDSLERQDVDDYLDLEG